MPAQWHVALLDRFGFSLLALEGQDSFAGFDVLLLDGLFGVALNQRWFQHSALQSNAQSYEYLQRRGCFGI